MVDVLRPGGQDLLWRGGAQGVLDESASREERRKRLDETIVKILSQFPPP